MPDVSVDNTPVAVAVEAGESFTPATDVTIVANMQSGSSATTSLSVSEAFVSSIASTTDSNTASEVSVVLTDETTVTTGDNGVTYISGFEV